MLTTLVNFFISILVVYTALVMYFYFLMIKQNLSVCQSQNYNQDTELTTLCNVNKAVPCFCLPWYTGKKTFSSKFLLYLFVLNINIQYITFVIFILGVNIEFSNCKQNMV